MFGLQRFSRFGKSGEKNHFLATTQDKQRHLAGVLKEKPLGHVQCPCSKSWLWGTPTPSPLLNCLSMQLCWVVGPSHPGGLPCLPRSRASLAAVPLRAQGRQAGRQARQPVGGVAALSGLGAPAAAPPGAQRRGRWRTWLRFSWEVCQHFTLPQPPAPIAQIIKNSPGEANLGAVRLFSARLPPSSPLLQKVLPEPSPRRPPDRKYKGGGGVSPAKRRLLLLLLPQPHARQAGGGELTALLPWLTREAESGVTLGGGGSSPLRLPCRRRRRRDKQSRSPRHTDTPPRNPKPRAEATGNNRRARSSGPSPGSSGPVEEAETGLVGEADNSSP